MKINLTRINLTRLNRNLFHSDMFDSWDRLVYMAVPLSIISTIYSFIHHYILLYGDAESHINIAKRVVQSLTPGMAQLGGIWLPLPHLLMIPFVYFDFLWRTGLAGSIVSGILYVIAAIYVYKLVLLQTKNKLASFIAFLVFALNPNILYMQTTPMTEIPLIAFFTLSTYYFISFLHNDSDISVLILAAFFGFLASLTRYDGWFLVMLEAGVIILKYLPKRANWSQMEGKIILFSTLAFFGIIGWLLWGGLILGDPLYFTHSVFSAKSQQSAWLQRGELPAYNNLPVAFLYYLVTSMSNIGAVLFTVSLVGLLSMLNDKTAKQRFLSLLILLAPFIFNVATLFLGQSVIFIPSLTPITFEWRLFNVRYGTLMIPVAAVLIGYLFNRSNKSNKWLISGLLAVQLLLFGFGYTKNITLADGLGGLSSAKHSDAEIWMSKNYDGGLVLIDDYARSMSTIYAKIPMQDIIYIGTKPYWQVSLEAPETYARWIVMQRHDSVWNNLYENPTMQGRLFKYFQKVYTSQDLLIFKQIPPSNESRG